MRSYDQNNESAASREYFYGGYDPQSLSPPDQALLDWRNSLGREQENLAFEQANREAQMDQGWVKGEIPATTVQRAATAISRVLSKLV